MAAPAAAANGTPGGSQASASVAAASPSPSPAPSAPVSQGRTEAHRAMSLLLRNEFNACRELSLAGASRGDLQCGLVRCYMAIVEAISTHGEADLAAALVVVWDLSKQAEKQKSIAGQLIQADTHFLGALVQILSQSRLKAALNLRKSWNYYESANKSLASYEGVDAAELRGWCQYGLGLFNLVMSLLPPTVMKVAGWAGYGGDREKGLALLRVSQQSPSFMAPFSCLLLLTYLVNVSSLTGESDDSLLPQCDSLLAWADQAYPGGVLFLLQRSRLHRCRRDLVGAIRIAKQAISACRELPRLAVLIHFHTGSCSFFLLDWAQSAYFFDCMLHDAPSGAYVPPEGVAKVSPAEQALIDEERQQGETQRLPPAKASALTFYAVLVGVNYMLLGNPHKARWYLSLVSSLSDPKSSKPIDLYAKRKAADMLSRPHGDPPEDALLDAGELIFTWNGAHQMPADSLRRMLAMLDAAHAKALPHWRPEHLAAVHLYKADMYKGLDDIPAALHEMEQFVKFVPQLKSSAKAKADGTLAFGWYLSAFLLAQADRLQQASEHLKLAQNVSGYDQYDMTQVRIHALAERIKKVKAEAASSSSSGGSSK